MTRVRTAVLLTGLAAMGLPLLAAAPASAAPVVRSSVTMYSDPGDFIGQGAAQLFDSTNAAISLKGDRGGVSVFVDGGTAAAAFSFQISPAQGGALSRGVYEKAVRSSSPAQPGLDIYGDGRGCNTVAGSFEVRDIAFASGGAVSRLHLLYEEHCEGGTPALFGEVRYREPVAAGIVTTSSSLRWPITYPGAATTVVPVTVRAVGRSVRVASVRLAGADASTFALRVDECTGVTVPAGGSCQVLLRFSPTTGGPRSGSLVFTDGGGRRTSVQLDGSVRTGTTALQLKGDPGEFITQGRTYAFTPGPARFAVAGSRQRISAVVDSGTDRFTVDMVPAAGDVIAPGTYEGATRYPLNGSTPGLNVDGDSRGCNTLTGSFTIVQALFSPADGSLQHLDATFVQHCEGLPAALRGRLSYQATSDVTAPARVTRLTAVATAGGARLTWTPAGDGQRTVVRALPGTNAPTRPDTGISVPVSGSTAVATGLMPGTAYAFAVFPVDGTGNVGLPSVVRASAGAASTTLES